MAEDRGIVQNTIEYNLGATCETDCNRLNIKIKKAQYFSNLCINISFYFQISCRPTAARNIYGTRKGSRGRLSSETKITSWQAGARTILSSRCLAHFFNPI
jgi:hypothetical protein